jgi:hypothetical protein
MHTEIASNGNINIYRHSINNSIQTYRLCTWQEKTSEVLDLKMQSTCLELEISSYLE